jgi:hypothetical protein
MNRNQSNGARTLIWLAVIALIVLHQDFWFWTTFEPLVFGFLPIGLAYHVGISIAAAVVWFLATKYCFPVDEDSAGATPVTAPEGDK